MKCQTQKGKEIGRRPGDADFMKEFPYLGDILPSTLSCLLDQGSSLPFCHSLTSPSSFLTNKENLKLDSFIKILQNS